MKPKICRLCKKKIKKKDNYVRLTDYKAGEFYDEGFYHTLCYIDRFKHVITKDKLKKILPVIIKSLKQKLNIS